MARAYIERYNRVRHWARTNGAFNGSLRHEWLDQYIIESIEEAQDHATQWLWTYNNDRPNMGTYERSGWRALLTGWQMLWYLEYLVQ